MKLNYSLDFEKNSNKKDLPQSKVGLSLYSQSSHSKGPITPYPFSNKKFDLLDRQNLSHNSKALSLHLQILTDFIHNTLHPAHLSYIAYNLLDFHDNQPDTHIYDNFSSLHPH